MAELPFMPLAVESWEADTSHLTDAQDGLYGRLVRLLWKSPGQRIPNEDGWIAHKLRRTVEAVASEVRPLLKEFFQTDGNWIKHKRVTKEWRRAIKTTRQRSEAAKSRWNKKKDASERTTGKHDAAVILTPTLTLTLTLTPTEVREDPPAADARARCLALVEESLPEVRNDLRAYPALTSSQGMVEAWIREGADLERDIVPAITAECMKLSAKGKKPIGFSWFAEAVAANKARNTAPLPEVANGKFSRSESRAEGAERDRREGIAAGIADLEQRRAAGGF